MRIVDGELWTSPKARLGEIAASPAATRNRESGSWTQRRPNHLLTGLVVCGCCMHPLASVGQDYLRCSRTHRNDLCTNKSGIRRPVLEHIVITALPHSLMQPALVAAFIAEFHSEMNRSRGDVEQERRGLGKRLAEVEKQFDALIRAIERPSSLQARMDELETGKAMIKGTLAQPAPSPFRLHRNLAELYRQNAAALHKALRADESRAEVFER